MARITKFVKSVQNNWKKSLFGVAAISYGINYANEKYKINRLMRDYCAEASIFGDSTQPAHQPFQKIIVILNPVADRKSAADTVCTEYSSETKQKSCLTNLILLFGLNALFEKYCAPILNLGGLSIDIVQTDSEAHARRYVEDLDQLPHAILCAGGDGTLSEIVTGLFRRPTYGKEEQPMIGIIPVGRQNTFGEKLFKFVNSSEFERVRGLADASLSIVRGDVKPKDVMRIEVINNDPGEYVKPVYALTGFEWSVYADAFHQRDKYWYYGVTWRDYVTFILNAFSNSITWNCSATITYTETCAGCSNCYITPNKIQAKPVSRRWWSGFIPTFRLGSSQSSNGIDHSKVQNPNCTVKTSIECDSAGIIVNTNGNDEQTFPHLDLKLIKGSSGFSFISDSFTRLNNNHINVDKNIAVRTIEIVPKIDETDAEQEKFFYIDHESYEVKPIRITLLPKLVNFYST